MNDATPQAARRRSPNPFDLNDISAYCVWREHKLANYPRDAGELMVEVADLAAPTAVEKSALIARCRRANMAVYATPKASADVHAHGARDATRQALRRFGSAFGLVSMEKHRSSDDDGIVAIEVTEAEGKQGFIPYTKRAISWHTDGYYNATDEAIDAMLLHCARPAHEGGVNALLDQDIAYIRLRDANPALVAAMMHPEAMTIPESVEEDGRVRPVSVGPVFIVNGASLTMRYTARTRSIHWRDDADTRAAVALLDRLLAHEEEPLIIKYRMQAGEGLICNNVLHTRTAFENDGGAGRLLYRVRYRERIAGT